MLQTVFVIIFVQQLYHGVRSGKIFLETEGKILQ